MASELQETLDRIVNKSNILIEKYHALEEENNSLSEQVESLRTELEKLKKAGEQLQMDNKYLKIARNVASNPDEVKEVKSIIASMVRDIDKCISQLNE